MGRTTQPSPDLPHPIPRTGTFRSRRIPMLASAIVLLFSVSLWFVKQFNEPVW